VATRAKTSVKDPYEEDLYAWSHDQAALLRAGRFDALDLEHLIEQVEDLAGSLRSAVRSRATTVMEHLLKLQHSPAQNPRVAWRETVRTQRTRLLNDLTPSLQRHLADRLPELYARPARCRGLAARPWRAGRRRRAAGELPLHARSDHRRLAAVTGPWAATSSHG
jgi:Domain of unknown function DUF29